MGAELPELLIREAREDDIPAIVALYAADTLGGHGDTTEAAALPDYVRAFKRIAKSPNDSLYVAELDGEVVGVFQTTLITSITGRGGINLTVEAIQTRSDMRGQGVGAAMMGFAVDRGREAGVRIDPAHIEQGAGGRSPFLRAARFHRESRRLQAKAQMLPALAFEGADAIRLTAARGPQ